MAARAIRRAMWLQLALSALAPLIRAPCPPRGEPSVPTWAYRRLHGRPPPFWTFASGFHALATRKSHSRTTDRDCAEVEVVCCLYYGNVRALATLPRRPPERPYLVWHEAILEAAADFTALRASRNDLVFTSFSRVPSPGFAFAPEKFFSGVPPANLSVPPRYFVTCRATLKKKKPNPAVVRDNLAKSFGAEHVSAERRAELARRGVVVEMLPHEIRPDKFTPDSRERYKELMDTAYALVPRGDGVWSYRMSEAVGACSVPVLLADGVQLPYEPVIDWAGAAIILPEKLALQPDALLARLPSDPRTITAMRERVCAINAQHFRSHELRWRAMLLSAVTLATSGSTAAAAGQARGADARRSSPSAVASNTSLGAPASTSGRSGALARAEPSAAAKRERMVRQRLAWQAKAERRKKVALATSATPRIRRRR